MSSITTPSLVRLNVLMLPDVALNDEEIQHIFSKTGAAHAFQLFPGNWVFMFDSFDLYMKSMGTTWELPPVGVRSIERKVKMTVVADDGVLHQKFFRQVYDLAFVENPKTQLFAVKFSMEVIGFKNMNSTFSFEKLKKQASNQGSSSIFNVLSGTMLYEDFIGLRVIIDSLKGKCIEELDHTKFLTQFNEQLSFADFQKENMVEGELLTNMLSSLDEMIDRLQDGMERMQERYDNIPMSGIKVKHEPSRTLQ